MNNKQQLKDYSPEFHKGIILDDSTDSSWKPEEMLSFIDVERGRNIDIKWTSVDIGPNCHKIIITNKSVDQFFRKDSIVATQGEAHWEAICGRLSVLALTKEDELFERKLSSVTRGSGINNLPKPPVRPR